MLLHSLGHTFFHSMKLKNEFIHSFFIHLVNNMKGPYSMLDPVRGPGIYY